MHGCRFKQVLPAHRAGFTWVELLVVIAILALLAAMILPSVRNARTPAHRTQCQSNLRNVGIAMQAYATARHGDLPPLTGAYEIANPHPDKRSGETIPAPWSVVLLPYMEQATLNDQLRSHPTRDEFQKLAQTTIETYRCPSATTTPDAGGLSYVVNVGMIAEDIWSTTGRDSVYSATSYDFGFNGYGAGNRNADDAEAAYCSGVFWSVPVGTAKTDATPHPLSLDQISTYDGTSQTVLLTENLQTRSYDPQTGTGGWISNELGDIAFGIAVPGTRVEDGFQVASSDIPGGLGVAGGGLATALTLSHTPVPPQCRINANLTAVADGRSPRPSSLHPHCVNMAFADGSCKVISDQIDASVYARLLSPRGGARGQKVLGDADF